LLAFYLASKVASMHIGIIISLIFVSLLFFLWQYSKGEQIGRRIGFLLNIWGAVIVFYLLMIVFL
jgi:hypothetical protein